MSEEKKVTNKEVIAYLASKYPLCFSIEGEAKPLKVGIFQDIAEDLTENDFVSKTQLRQALRQYTSNWRYLHGCRIGAERVDLQGNSCGVLDEEHAQHASQALQQAKAKYKEQVKQKQQAKRQDSPSANKKNRAHPKKMDVKSAESEVSQKPTRTKAKRSEPKVAAIDINSITKGQVVKVKVANDVLSAIVMDVMKDTARVELKTGMVINVKIEHLYQ